MKLWQLLVLALLSSCSTDTSRPLSIRKPAVQIDHIIVGVSDLETGIRELEQLTGVRPVIGGTHPGRGTQNALLSLGDGVYLELYAPDPRQNVNSPAVTELKGLTGLKPIGWAVSSADVDALSSYLGSLGLPLSSPEPGSRVLPSGTLIEWATLGYEEVDHSLAPFFIHWKQQELHPSRTSPSGCRLVSVRLRDPAPIALDKAVQPLRLNIPVDGGREKKMEVRLSCPRGPVVLS